MSTTLLLSASAIFFIAFVDYNRGVITGKNTPAFAAWAVFSLITLVNGITYLSWTASWVNSVVLFTDCLICTATAIVVLVRKRGRVSVDETDKRIVLLSLVAVFLWTVFNTAVGGNILNQVAYSLAFVPTYRNALHDPRDEPTRPWALWTLAFVINLVALFLQPTTKPMDYLSPAVCLFHHAALTVLSLRKP